MNIINLVMFAAGILTIFFGFIYGFRRGFSKAVARLVIVGACAVVAFLYREKISEIVLNTPISEGKTILELLTESMASGEDAEKMQGLVNVITNILKMVRFSFSFKHRLLIKYIILR